MPRPIPTWLCAALGLGAWCSAGLLLAFREHFVYQYVVRRDVPLDDAQLGVSLLALAAIGLAAMAGAIVATRRGDEARHAGRRACAWMISCAVIPALEQLRRLGIDVPTTFLEPLYFGFATTMSVWALRSGSLGRSLVSTNGAGKRPQSSPRPHAAWDSPASGRLWLVALITLAAAWWFYQGEQSYRDYQLGYPDFAEYAHRLVNTWKGRGFLARPPNWPAFYDHFNPGLALLAPLWGIWPDARLVILVQALCLAVPAAFVAGLARRFGASPAGAVAWAAAYLVLPAVGQLNLNYSYGFHPVSLALVTVSGGLWAAFARRPWLALALAAVSCAFEESVFVALAGMSLAIAAVEFQGRDKERTEVRSPTGVPVWVWLLAALGFAAGFVLVVRVVNLTPGTLRWRFGNLGDSLTAAALSPVLRPKVFWGQIFRTESLYFVLVLFVPAGLLFVPRGWRALLGLAAPLLVLLTWSVDGSTCIALQYVTLLIPCIVLAALLGASSIADREPPERHAHLMALAGVATLAGGTIASIFFGALPVSRPTIPFTLSAREREELGPRHMILDRAVETVSTPDAAVLASCRLAAHLLKARRLEDVNFALRKREALAEEAQRTERQQWIEVFDWVAVDLKDRYWNHSLEDLKTVVFAAEAAGYQAVLAARGVLVYHRPRPGFPLQDALRPWRVSGEEAERLARNRPSPPQQSPGLRVLRLVVGTIPSIPTKAEVEVVLQATKDGPPEYCFQYILADAQGATVAETGMRLPAGDNRPSNWWRKGEAWRDRMTIDLPPGKTLAELHGRLDILPLEPLLQSLGEQAAHASAGS